MEKIPQNNVPAEYFILTFYQTLCSLLVNLASVPCESLMK